MLNWIKRFFTNNNYKLQTFTYYIPAPPPRDSGYREKQFDKIFFEFINKGYELIDLTTQSHNGNNSQGMWVIATVRATNKSAEELDLEFDRFISDSNGLEVSLEGEKVEGLYHLKD